MSTQTFPDLIPLVNKLQDVFSTISSNDLLDLPQIVVVGSQSSGKSSVLENIVQRDFLPRGSGIVTRRPLVLQLVTLPEPAEGKPAPEEYGEFLHVPSKHFYDFSEIRKEIEAETQRVAGGNKGISRMPIHLKVYSTKVLNLTLVDLPGLTKATNLLTSRSRPATSLLTTSPSPTAVTPANIDLVNSDSLKLSRQVDPEGRRTIGVLTKLDLMDAGTNALDILSGRAYPLKLGFVGTVNRSQQDILTSKPMTDALKSEADFFKQHPAYRNIAHRCGTAFLSKQLNNILMNHIRDRLPDMKAKLNSMIGQTQQELASYGDPAFTGKAHRGSLILKLLTKFANDFVASIDGTSLEISTKELCGGARIYFIFNNVFGTALESIPPCANLTVHDIRVAIRNSTGPRPSLFVPEIAFDLLVKPQIKLLEPPSLRCVELAYEELMKICHSCGSKELQRFPRLHAKLLEVVSDLLRERLGPTSQYVESLLSIQRAYINTNHPDFLGAAGAMSALEQTQKKKKLQEKKRIMASTAITTDIKQGSTLGTPPNSVTGGPGRDRDRDRDDPDNSPAPSINGAMGVPGARDRERDRDFSSGIDRGFSTAANSMNGLHVTESPSQRGDSFLNYFFGGASKSDRSALGSQEVMTSAKYVPPPMSMNNIIEAELERKFETASISDNNSNGEMQLTEREELETQLPDHIVLQHCAQDDPGPGPQGHHAPTGQLLSRIGAEPAGGLAVQRGTVRRPATGGREPRLRPRQVQGHARRLSSRLPDY
ncbi:Dynamin central region-domain-containing protein [Jimgerdemannia flammicorona]|uniref:dynamin GTPase n=1 Tax=Jimgerdemannia flammicorona TaxID=994334 RepID=A0A433DCR0_9FUNG|nr:Dynamin central region-domain-containing protein [Jimgerdemannia flammicorona]